MMPALHKTNHFHSPEYIVVGFKKKKKKFQAYFRTNVVECCDSYLPHLHTHEHPQL